jgi:superfamily II DNA/RNA helicase
MLAAKLYQLASFQRQYKAVIVLSVCQTIEQLQWYEAESEIVKRIDWNNLLGIGSVLSYSDDFNHLDAALRIAQTCLTQPENTVPQKSAAALILENLTNQPAIALALGRNFLSTNYEDNFSPAFKFQTLKTRIAHTIQVNNRLLSLNRFQKQVYDSYETNETISISAPTSAGKSFILCNILLQELAEKRVNIVYLVPTRALISQVESDLRELVQSNDLRGVNISSVPQAEGFDERSQVFIFTQERLHWFLSENNGIRLDILIVDEAQKIEDGNRGILLQQKIEEVVSLYPDIRIYFSSPFTSNPEILFENLNNNGRKAQINTQFVSVNQNLIYAYQFPKQQSKWVLTLCIGDKTIVLGFLQLKDRPTTTVKKVTMLAASFTSNGNIIYANGAAEAEEIAIVLYDLLPEAEPSPKILELIKLVGKTIHRKYALCSVLKKGIAFHYGNMPLLIRQQIESLFKQGDIKYLICTSTLLEGVNLPAKSIFIKKPTRGNNKPLNENDFWNLAGRAGRWGKEFSGNIICIEPATWKTPPNPNKSKQKISRAIDNIEAKRFELLDYIDAESPRTTANTRQDLEFAFGYFYQKYQRRELDNNNEYHAALLKRFDALAVKITIPNYILKRNPGISPIAQQSLYEYFETKTGDLEDLVPVYPEDANAINEYMGLIGRIGKTIAAYPPMLNHSRSILLINWMTGKPLAYLIITTFNWYQSKDAYKTKKTLPIVIREVMENVEEFVRFRFAKDSSCYVDILRFFLEKRQPDLIDGIPQLTLWLEFGVSQKTQLSLLSLGLSRNTVIELSNYITNSSMDKAECLVWIEKQELDLLDLSPIIQEDIRKNIGKEGESDT